MTIITKDDSVWFNAVILEDDEGKLHIYNPIPPDLHIDGA